MQKLPAFGRARSICNFGKMNLEKLLSHSSCTTVPAMLWNELIDRRLLFPFPLSDKEREVANGVRDSYTRIIHRKTCLTNFLPPTLSPKLFLPESERCFVQCTDTTTRQPCSSRSRKIQIHRRNGLLKPRLFQPPPSPLRPWLSRRRERHRQGQPCRAGAVSGSPHHPIHTLPPLLLKNY